MATSYHEQGFPPKSIDWVGLVPLIGQANAAVARYDGMLIAIPNPDVLLSPLMTNEAVLSSRIEGTQATLNEVLAYEAEEKNMFQPKSAKEAEMQEILNYRQAMRVAEKRLEELPLSQRLVREAHGILLSGVRGQNKAPGEYRKVPNWIGPAGCDRENARYLPPDAVKLPALMSEWEKYIHAEERDPLIKLAVMHAEFEALHPFLDGNGRLGRMIIPLFLYQAKLLQRPAFYISAYLEKYRDAYYDRLLEVSRYGDWSGWCEFFLRAICVQAEENQHKVTDILNLYNKMKLDIVAITGSKYAIHTVDGMFESPFFTLAKFIQRTQVPRQTATRIIDRLVQQGILRLLRPGSGRSSKYVGFPALLDILG